MNRAEKKALVSTLRDVFGQAGVVVVAHYAGLSVAQMTDLRARMRAEGAAFRVTKNRMAKLALVDSDVAHLDSLFSGPTAIAYSDDPVTAPRILVKFARENEKLVVLGGTMGETPLDVSAVKALAALPSLDALRGELVGLLMTPATRVAQVLSAPGGQIARVLNAYAQRENT